MNPASSRRADVASETSEPALMGLQRSLRDGEHYLNLVTDQGGSAIYPHSIAAQTWLSLAREPSRRTKRACVRILTAPPPRNRELVSPDPASPSPGRAEAEERQTPATSWRTRHNVARQRLNGSMYAGPSPDIRRRSRGSRLQSDPDNCGDIRPRAHDAISAIVYPAKSLLRRTPCRSRPPAANRRKSESSSSAPRADRLVFQWLFTVFPLTSRQSSLGLADDESPLVSQPSSDR